jgi:hypothetical protein
MGFGRTPGMDNDDTCPCCDLCGGPLGIMGILGNTEHLQCRNCGMEFSRPVNPETDSSEDADCESP